MKYDIILQLCFPQISPHRGLFEGGLICKNDFKVGAYPRGTYSEVGAYSRIYGMGYPHSTYQKFYKISTPPPLVRASIRFFENSLSAYVLSLQLPLPVATDIVQV